MVLSFVAGYYHIKVNLSARGVNFNDHYNIFTEMKRENVSAQCTSIEHGYFKISQFLYITNLLMFTEIPWQ